MNPKDQAILDAMKAFTAAVPSKDWQCDVTPMTIDGTDANGIVGISK